MDESSTFMNVASDRAIVPHRRAEPCNGGRGMKLGAVAMTGVLRRRFD
jgi:hypothetical protein